MFSSSRTRGSVGDAVQGAHTASTIVVEFVSGSHVLTVEGYSHTLGLGVGKSMQSDSFIIGGHTWSIAYYPDSCRPRTSGWMSLGLMLPHAAAAALNSNLRCSFSLLDQDGRPAPEHTTAPCKAHSCIGEGCGVVLSRFISRDQLERSAYLADDSFSVRCDFTFTNIRTKEEKEEEEDKEGDMHEQLARVLDTGEAADVSFQVCGYTFAAHWCVLAARSTVFMAQFLSVKETAGATPCVQMISGMEPRVFQAMLHFIYTDSLPEMIDQGETAMDMAQRLLVAANRYHLQRLKFICTNMLCSLIDTSTVATMLAFSEQHGCTELKEACMHFLGSFQNLKAVIWSDDFENLKTTHPNILEELVANAVDAPRSNHAIANEDTSAPAHTTSSIVAQGVCGSHVLRVQGYSHTLGHGVSNSIPSSIFGVGGHRWKIKYYPDGILDCSDWISVSLHLHHTDATQVKVRCRFSLLDHVGKPVPKYTTTTASQTIMCYDAHDKGDKNMIEFPRFIKRDELEGSTYLKDDCFSIGCDVDVAMGFRTQPTTQLITVPPCGMAHQFGHILDTGDGADVIFEVCREKFVAHRRLLAARSSVFMAQFFGSTKKNHAMCLRINNMEARVFKMMLYFIYTDSVPRIDDNEIREVAQQLFVAADRYDLHRLKLICTNMLCNCIDTVATTLAFAEQHGFEGLKKACFKFLASFSNLKAVRATDGFKKLKGIHPNILEELIVQGNAP